MRISPYLSSFVWFSCVGLMGFWTPGFCSAYVCGSVSWRWKACRWRWGWHQTHQTKDFNISVLPCEEDEAEAGIHILWPRRVAEMTHCWWNICDISSFWEWSFFSYDESCLKSVCGSGMLIRNGDTLSPGITPAKLRTRIWGNFSFNDGFITALVMTLDHGENRSRRMVTRADMLMSRSMNIEVFGIEDGHYLAQARRWKTQKFIGYCNEQNLSNLKVHFTKKNMRGGSNFHKLFWSRSSGHKPLISRLCHVQVVLVDHERRSRTERESFQKYTKTSDILHSCFTSRGAPNAAGAVGKGMMCHSKSKLDVMAAIVAQHYKGLEQENCGSGKHCLRRCDFTWKMHEKCDLDGEDSLIYCCLSFQNKARVTNICEV